MFRWGLVIISLFISGCSSIPRNIDANYTLEEGASNGKGLILLSVSKSESDTWKNGYFAMDFDKETGSALWLPIQADQKELDFNNADGRLIVLEVPAGEHFLSHWYIVGPPFANYAVLPHFAPERLHVNVVEGQVHYLGNLHLEVRTESDPALGYTVWIGPAMNQSGGILGLIQSAMRGDPKDQYESKVVPSISDQSDRDVPFFLSKYKNVDPSRIKHTLFKQGIWRVGDNLDHKWHTPTPIPNAPAIKGCDETKKRCSMF